MVTKYRILVFLIIKLVITVSLVNGMDLPDPLVTTGGQAVDSIEQWKNVRRPEVLELFREHVYGRAPDIDPVLKFEVIENNGQALDGKAIRRQVRMTLVSGDKTLSAIILIYLPVCAKDEPVPGFLLLNFSGNHTVHTDPEIVLSEGYVRESYLPKKAHRGAKQSRFPIASIIERGYGFITTCYGDLDPDFNDGFKDGLHGLYASSGPREKDAWGSVAAWAWGLSRIMDYLETDPEIDHSRTALLGHSRLGKTALWAGAEDERFSIIISNDSGCTGAALARNRKGETVKRINDVFPHWFCENYKAYNDREDDLPVDQHMLIALAAPRPIYVASATEDTWADPEGEFMACVEAGPVYSLFGLEGVGTAEQPAPDQPINTGHIGYHIRTGRHNLTPYDWECFMDFASRHWKANDE